MSLTSQYPKPQNTRLPVANGSRVDGGKIQLVLNSDHLTPEHEIFLYLTQVFATTAPSAVGDLSNLIELIEVKTDRGTEMTLDGYSLKRLNNMNENVSSQRVTLGLNTTAMVPLELHYLMDGALRDLLTAMQTKKRSPFELVITLASDTSPYLTGGVGAGIPSYSVNVKAKRYPSLTSVGNTFMGDIFAFDGEGNPLTESDIAERQLDPEDYALNIFHNIGTKVHRINMQPKLGTASGAIEPIRLVAAGSALRFLQVISLDNSGASPVVSDDIVDNIRVVANGVEEFNGSFQELQAANERERDIVVIGSGCACVDKGDDENEFMDLSESNEALLYLTIKAGAPSWLLRISEDYVAQN